MEVTATANSLEASLTRVEVCQMVYFQTKNPSFGLFGRPWNGKFGYNFMAILVLLGKSIWCILPFGIFCGNLVYKFSHFGMLHQEKSGNPVRVA
jgi:hypothetical protein